MYVQYSKAILIFLLLSGTLFSKEMPREFFFEKVLFDIKPTTVIHQTMSPSELLQPVTKDSNCDVDFQILFEYLWN